MPIDQQTSFSSIKFLEYLYVRHDIVLIKLSANDRANTQSTADRQESHTHAFCHELIRKFFLTLIVVSLFCALTSKDVVPLTRTG